jgi:hypothetical protein
MELSQTFDNENNCGKVLSVRRASVSDCVMMSVYNVFVAVAKCSK